MPIFYIKWSREAGIMYPTLQMARKFLKGFVFGPPVGFEIEGVCFWNLFGEADSVTDGRWAVEEDQRCEKVGLSIVGTRKCLIKLTLPKICTL
mgnify:CR=1 FL=1